ncbi:MAG: hypothetical protein JOY71_13295 [Acetobacteraceae bacterium]|nr:hypothetical protein [Acetobacteraceae bacterium]MBV8523076.1 hypothetical protein [Acetobacteraceae bacterium]MBV8592510.1 hypothetical protein [Acetobacteraceae bacterium]
MLGSPTETIRFLSLEELARLFAATRANWQDLAGVRACFQPHRYMLVFNRGIPGNRYSSLSLSILRHYVQGE